MDLKEILKEAGVEDKAIKQIITTMKAEKIYTTSEENADIRLKKNKEKIEKLESELGDAVTKIESFKDLENEKETLSKEVENLKKAATEKDFNTALTSALKEAKVKNEKLVKALLDNEKLTLKDGKLEGIEDQLKTIKEENDFLFEKTPGGVPDFSTGGKGTWVDPKAKSIGEKLAEAKSQAVEIKY
ncbi:phage scaffolding protein [uncultured Clostridium sp.]|uniref:phage scaffolding protein n=1 Tax=uncultured Clostridium sp. TaxID=59620 RepID=UPI00262EDC5C|nr:phage scaffolding protein [uncultured Clostridium sp.]